MATRIEYTIDVNGNLAAVETTARRIQNHMEAAKQAAKEQARWMQTLSQAQSRMGGGTFGPGQDQGLSRGASGAGGRGDTRDFARQAQGLGGLVHLYATYAANVYALTTAFQALSKAQDVTNMFKSMTVLSAQTGVNIKGLSKDMEELTGHAVALQDAARYAAMGSVAGLSPDTMKQLAAGAKAVSVALGRDINDSLDRLVRGITKLEPELLDELGIITKAGDAYKQYAKAHGIAESSMSSTEKQAAYTTAVLNELNTKWSVLAKSGETNSFKQLEASLVAIKQSALETVNVGIAPLAKSLAEAPAALGVALASMSAMLVNKAIPLLASYKKARLEAMGEEIEKQRGANLLALTSEDQAKFHTIESLRRKQAELQVDLGDTLSRQATTTLQSIKSQAAGVAQLLGTSAKWVEGIKGSLSLEALRNNPEIINSINRSVQMAESKLQQATAANNQTNMAVYQTRLNALRAVQDSVTGVIAADQQALAIQQQIATVTAQRAALEAEVTAAHSASFTAAQRALVAEEARANAQIRTATYFSSTGMVGYFTQWRQSLTTIRESYAQVKAANLELANASTGAMARVTAATAGARAAMSTFGAVVTGVAGRLLALAGHPAILALTVLASLFGPKMAEALGISNPAFDKMNEALDRTKESVTVTDQAYVDYIATLNKTGDATNNATAGYDSAVKANATFTSSLLASTQAIKEQVKTSADAKAHLEANGGFFAKLFNKGDVQEASASALRELDSATEKTFQVMERLSSAEKARANISEDEIASIKAQQTEVLRLTKIQQDYNSGKIRYLKPETAAALANLSALTADWADKLNQVVEKSKQGSEAIAELVRQSKSLGSDAIGEFSKALERARFKGSDLAKQLDNIEKLAPESLNKVTTAIAQAERLKNPLLPDAEKLALQQQVTAFLNQYAQDIQTKLVPQITNMSGVSEQSRTSLANTAATLIALTATSNNFDLSKVMEQFGALLKVQDVIAGAFVKPAGGSGPTLASKLGEEIQLLNEQANRLDKRIKLRLELGVPSEAQVKEKYEILRKIANTEAEKDKAENKLSSDEIAARQAERLRNLDLEYGLELLDMQQEAYDAIYDRISKASDVLSELLEVQRDLGGVTEDYADYLSTIQDIQVSSAESTRDIVNQLDALNVRKASSGDLSESELSTINAQEALLRTQLNTIGVLSTAKTKVAEQTLSDARNLAEVNAAYDLAVLNTERLNDGLKATGKTVLDSFDSLVDSSLRKSVGEVAKELRNAYATIQNSTNEADRLAASTAVASIEAKVLSDAYSEAKQSISDVKEILVKDSVALESAESFGVAMGISFSEKFNETFRDSSLSTTVTEAIFEGVSTGVDTFVQALRGNADLSDVFEGFAASLRDSVYTALGDSLKKSLLQGIGVELLGLPEDMFASETQKLTSAIQEQTAKQFEAIKAEATFQKGLNDELKLSNQTLTAAIDNLRLALPNSSLVGAPSGAAVTKVVGSNSADTVAKSTELGVQEVVTQTVKTVDLTQQTNDLLGQLIVSLEQGFTATAVGIASMGKGSSGSSNIVSQIIGAFKTAGKFTSDFSGYVSKAGEFVKTAGEYFNSDTIKGLGDALSSGSLKDLLSSYGYAAIGAYIGSSLGKNQYTQALGGAVGGVAGAAAAGYAGYGVAAGTSGAAGAYSAIAATGPWAALAAAALAIYFGSLDDTKVKLGYSSGTDNFEDNKYATSAFGLNFGAMEFGSTKIDGQDWVDAIAEETIARQAHIATLLDVTDSEKEMVKANLMMVTAGRKISDKGDVKSTINNWILNDTAAILDALVASTSKLIYSKVATVETGSYSPTTLTNPTSGEDYTQMAADTQEAVVQMTVWGDVIRDFSSKAKPAEITAFIDKILNLFDLWERDAEALNNIGISEAYKDAIYSAVDTAKATFISDNPFVKALDGLNLEDLGFDTVLESITNLFTVTSNYAKALNQEFSNAFDVTTLETDVASRMTLVNAAGGLEAFTSQVQYFTENMVPASKQMQLVYENAKNALEVDMPIDALATATGYTTEYINQLVATSDGYYTLMTSLNSSNDASGELRAQLLALAPAFKTAKDAAQEILTALTGIDVQQLQELISSYANATDMGDFYSQSNGSSVGQMFVDQILNGMFEAMVVAPVSQMIMDTIITPLLDSISGVDTVISELDMTEVTSNMEDFMAVMNNPAFIDTLSELSKTVDEVSAVMRKAVQDMNVDFMEAVIGVGTGTANTMQDVVDGMTAAIYQLEELDPSGLGDSIASYLSDPTAFLEDSGFKTFGEYVSNQISNSLIESLVIDPVASFLSQQISAMMTSIMGTAASSGAMAAGAALPAPIAAGGAAAGAAGGSAIAAAGTSAISAMVADYTATMTAILSDPAMQQFLSTDLPNMLNDVVGTLGLATDTLGYGASSGGYATGSSSSGGGGGEEASMDDAVQYLKMLVDIQSDLLELYKITSNNDVNAAYDAFYDSAQAWNEALTSLNAGTIDFTDPALLTELSRAGDEMAQAIFAEVYAPQSKLQQLLGIPALTQREIKEMEQAFEDSITNMLEMAEELRQQTLAATKATLDMRAAEQAGNTAQTDYYNTVVAPTTALSNINSIYGSAVEDVLGMSITNLEDFTANFTEISSTLAGLDFNTLTEQQAEAAAALMDLQYEYVQAEIDIANRRIQAVSDLESELRSLESAVNSVNSDIANLKKQMGDGGAALEAYNAEMLAKAKADLAAAQAAGDTDAIIDAAGRVQSALVDYTNTQIELYDSLKQFALDIKDYLDSLKIGDKSTLTMEQRLNEALRQFDQNVAIANNVGGAYTAEQVAQAQSNLTSSADDLLALAQQGYASGQGYQDIYSYVTSQLGQFVDVSQTAEEISQQLDAERNAFLQAQITELEAVQQILEEQKSLVEDELAVAMDSLAQSMAILTDLGYWGAVSSTYSESISPYLQQQIEILSATYDYLTGADERATGGEITPPPGEVPTDPENKLDTKLELIVAAKIQEALGASAENLIEYLKHFHELYGTTVSQAFEDIKAQVPIFIEETKQSIANAAAEFAEWNTDITLSFLASLQEAYNRSYNDALNTLGQQASYTGTQYTGSNASYYGGDAISNLLKSTNSFAVGTNYVPNDMFAEIHKGERIIPEADNLKLIGLLEQATTGSSSYVQSSEDIRAMKAELAALRAEAAKNAALIANAIVVSSEKNAQTVAKSNKDAATTQVEFAQQSRKANRIV